MELGGHNAKFMCTQMLIDRFEPGALELSIVSPQFCMLVGGNGAAGADLQKAS
jgi:hypothetical protein